MYSFVEITKDYNYNEYSISSQQVKTDSDQSGLALWDRPVAAISPGLPFSSASPTPELDVASKQAEGDTSRDLLPVNTASRSEAQEPPEEKPSSVMVPATEVARVQDFPVPQPIPPGESNSLACVSEHMRLCDCSLNMELVSCWQRCFAAGGRCPKWRKCKV